MGKFNKDAFVSKMATGAGLLNDVSRMEKAKRMEEIYVEADQIHPAKENQGISITKIEELAQAIQDVGLLSPLIVRQREDGEYKLVAGERRYRAIKMNIENGKWEKDDPIRCFLFDPEKIDLALSDEDKEEYVRLVENSNQRDKTDGDKLREIQKLKKIYEKLRREGDFSGSTRDHLVEDTGLSPSTIAQYTKVENQGSDELIDAVLENRVGISAATKIASLPEEEQAQVIEIAGKEKADGERITPQDVVKAKGQMERERKQKVNVSGAEASDPKKKQEVPEQEAVDGNRVTTKIFKKDIDQIMKKLKAEEAGITLDDIQYNNYLKHVRSLEKLILGR